MPYIYESKTNSRYPDATTAIVVLPDIYMQTGYGKDTCEQLAQTFARPTYLFDYFYHVTGQANSFTPDQGETAMALIDKLSGDDFVPAFATTLVEILGDRPRLQHFTVVGFCFGGRLAYLSGLEPSVDRIVSFYGAGAHTPGYYNGQTPVAALCAARKGDKGLQVLSFYGTEDDSIPSADRAKTKAELEKANIGYTAQEYPAGHAYFQPSRPNYNEAAAQQSWQNLKEFIND